MEGDVKAGPVGPDPGADVGHALRALRRVDVDAADDAAAAALQHRVGEARALRELLGVLLQIAEILLERHLRIRPAPALESGRGPDVVDARHPRLVVTRVVLRPERLQPELPGDQFAGHGEAVWYEGPGPVVRSHVPPLMSWPGAALPLTGCRRHRAGSTLRSRGWPARQQVAGQLAGHLHRAGLGQRAQAI